MTAFPLLAALLLACAMAFILVPLTRSRRSQRPVERSGVNAAVYRDQLRELAADLAAGTITRERHDEAVQEIERRVLEDVDPAAEHGTTNRSGGRAALVIALAVPFAAAMLYFTVGTPRALLPDTQAAASGGPPHGPDQQQIEALVERLAARMKAQPDDPQGWMILARSYAALGRFQEASAAYGNLVARVPPDAQILADYADVLAMAQGRTLEGEPEKVIAKALAADPDNVKALALAGSAAFEKGDFKGAVKHWQRLVQVAPADSELAQSARASIEEARARAGESSAIAASPPPATSTPKATSAPAPPASAGPSTAAAGVAVNGVVEIAPEIAAKVAPTDTLFVFARAAEGPRMPVAILRAQAKDLPFTFTLDDRSSMAGAKLSDQQKVIVGARVSKSGSAMPQAGDLQGYSAPVAPGATGLRIVVSEVVR